jgi:hypothetical protein
VNLLKLVLGGIVAVLSAFGLTVAIFVVVGEVRAEKATGMGLVAGAWFWLAALVIFALVLFLTYRKLYL